MTRRQQPALMLFAVGMIGLGILALVCGDFALVWQPVAAWVPGRTALAYLSGLIMLVGGVGLLFDATMRWSVRLLFPYLIVWALLKVPALVVAPKIEGVWLGFGELAVLLAGGWTLFAVLGGVREGSVPSFVAGERGVHCARIFFAVWVFPIGLAHIMYVKETAALVPAWLGFRNGWAYVTGFGQIACSLRRAVFGSASCGRCDGGGNDQLICASRVVACDCGCAEDTIALDCVLYLVGDRGWCLGGCSEYCG